MRSKAFVLAIATALCTGQAVAQDATNVVGRLLALRETDPELFSFIQSFLERSTRRAQIPGGFSFETDTAYLRCDETFDAGFDQCRVNIDISGQSYAEAPDNRYATLKIECEVQVRTRTASGWSDTIRKRENADLSFYGGGSARTSVSLRFDTYTPHDPTVHAAVADVDCKADDVR